MKQYLLSARAQFRDRRANMIRSTRAFKHSIFVVRAELATSAAIIAGWTLLTYGIVLFTTPKVWPLSAGVLLLAGCGWRLLWKLASDGLYVLTRPPRG